MYQIFVGDKPIILTTQVEQETDFRNYLLDTVSISRIIKDLRNPTINSVRLIDNNEDLLLKKFLKLLPNVVAGGGKVFNKKGDVLFIFRNDKWDLPKGRIEKRESIEEGAMREVKEETGIRGLIIERPLKTTYHIFKRNGRFRIKITYWFEMKTNYNGKLHPEESEGITKVKWISKDKWDKALKNSYANIRQLI